MDTSILAPRDEEAAADADPEVGSYVDEPHEARATQALSDAGTMRAEPPFGEIRL